MNNNWPISNELDFFIKDLYWDSNFKLFKSILILLLSLCGEAFLFKRKSKTNKLLLSDSNSPSTTRIENYILSNDDIADEILFISKLPKKNFKCILLFPSFFYLNKDFYPLLLRAIRHSNTCLEFIVSLINIIFYMKIKRFVGKSNVEIFVTHTSTSISTFLFNYSQNIKVIAIQHGNPSEAFFPSPVNQYWVFDENYRNLFMSRGVRNIKVVGLPWQLIFNSINNEKSGKAIYFSQLFSKEINRYSHVKSLYLYKKYCIENNLIPFLKPHPKDNRIEIESLCEKLSLKLFDGKMENCDVFDECFSMYSTALYEMKCINKKVGQILPHKSSKEEFFCYINIGITNDEIIVVDGLNPEHISFMEELKRYINE
ncbi:hypothetical protein [Photobacterium damselae]|uniref:hypothetical protein n=1 Tax=Photobacterium damselae TaxID=38293 RepID=UPI00254366C2